MQFKQKAILLFSFLLRGILLSLSIEEREQSKDEETEKDKEI